MKGVIFVLWLVIGSMLVIAAEDAFPQGVVSVSETDGTIGQTSTLLLSRDITGARSYWRLENKSVSAKIYLKVDSAHTATEGIVITAGSAYEPRIPFRNALYIKSDTSTAPYTLIVEQ